MDGGDQTRKLHLAQRAVTGELSREQTSLGRLE